MSQIKLYCHLIFATKHRESAINLEHCDDLYRFIAAQLRKQGCYVYAINGGLDHVHACIDLPSTVPPADIVRDVKRTSSSWASSCGLFPKFRGWGEGYGLFSVSPSHRDAVIEYIRKQKEHHRAVPFDDEYRRILNLYGIAFDDPA